MADALRFGDARIGTAFLEDYAAGTRAIGAMAAMIEDLAAAPAAAPAVAPIGAIDVGRAAAPAPLFALLEQV